MNPHANTDARINRLVGQIEGIRRMIRSARPASEVAQQILAARQALSKIGVIVLKDGVIKAAKAGHEKKVESLIEKIFRA